MTGYRIYTTFGEQWTEIGNIEIQPSDNQQNTGYSNYIGYRFLHVPPSLPTQFYTPKR